MDGRKGSGKDARKQYVWISMIKKNPEIGTFQRKN